MVIKLMHLLLVYNFTWPWKTHYKEYYDYLSIMHYPCGACGGLIEKGLEECGQSDISNFDHLSNGDIEEFNGLREYASTDRHYSGLDLMFKTYGRSEEPEDPENFPEYSFKGFGAEITLGNYRFIDFTLDFGYDKKPDEDVYTGYVTPKVIQYQSKIIEMRAVLTPYVTIGLSKDNWRESNIEVQGNVGIYILTFGPEAYISVDKTHFDIATHIQLSGMLQIGLGGGIDFAKLDEGKEAWKGSVSMKVFGWECYKGNFELMDPGD